jgi:hypothetical protein
MDFQNTPRLFKWSLDSTVKLTKENINMNTNNHLQNNPLTKNHKRKIMYFM